MPDAPRIQTPPIREIEVLLHRSEVHVFFEGRLSDEARDALAALEPGDDHFKLTSLYFHARAVQWTAKGIKIVRTKGASEVWLIPDVSDGVGPTPT